MTSLRFTSMQCSVCCESFRKPKVLPCGHSCCVECLREWADKVTELDELEEGVIKTLEDEAQDTTAQDEDHDMEHEDKKAEHEYKFVITCPECRHEFPLPVSGVDGLPTNVALARVSEPDVVPLTGSEGDALLCGDCEQQQRTVVCVDCEDWLCDTCGELHQKIKATRNHILLTKAQVEDGTYESILHDRKPKYRACAKHPEEVLKYFCVDCTDAICTDCLNISHLTHQRMMLEDKAKQILAIADQRKLEKERLCGRLVQRLEDIDTAEDRQQEATEQTMDSVCQRRDELIRVVQGCADSLIMQLETCMDIQAKSNEWVRHNIHAEIEECREDRSVVESALPYEIVEHFYHMKRPANKGDQDGVTRPLVADPKWTRWSFQRGHVTQIDPKSPDGKDPRPLTDQEVVSQMFGSLNKKTLTVFNGKNVGRRRKPSCKTQ